MRIASIVLLWVFCAVGFSQTVPWKGSFEEAKKEARATNKLIFLEFYGET